MEADHRREFSAPATCCGGLLIFLKTNLGKKTILLKLLVYDSPASIERLNIMSGVSAEESCSFTGYTNNYS